MGVVYLPFHQLWADWCLLLLFEHAFCKRYKNAFGTLNFVQAEVALSMVVL